MLKAQQGCKFLMKKRRDVLLLSEVELVRKGRLFARGAERKARSDPDSYRESEDLQRGPDREERADAPKFSVMLEKKKKPSRWRRLLYFLFAGNYSAGVTSSAILFS